MASIARLVWRWVAKLRAWEGAADADCLYPMLSAHELLGPEGKLHVIQSDASGDDGLGYFYGHYLDVDPHYTACRWGRGYLFEHSHDGELSAPLHYLQATNLSNCVLLWVTDCQAAVWSVNKGRCRDSRGLEILRALLQLCDDRRIVLVALWIPRERNLRADFLSHLAAQRGSDIVSGRMGDWDRLGRQP